LHLPTLEYWDFSYLLHPSFLLAHDTQVMLTSTQMVSLCAYCNHSFNYSQIIDLKNFQGPPSMIHPLDYFPFYVIKLGMVRGKHE
jgi:hypothetical protein